MIHALKVSTLRFLVVLWSAFAVLGLYVMLITWGPVLERETWPVMEWRGLTYYERKTGDVVEIQFAYEKKRTCDFVGASWFVGEPDTDFERVHIQLTNPNDRNGTRPLGKQRSHHYDITIPRSIQSMRHFGVVHYRCGLPWVTETILGPFPSWHDAEPELNRPTGVIAPEGRPPDPSFLRRSTGGLGPASPNQDRSSRWNSSWYSAFSPLPGIAMRNESQSSTRAIRDTVPRPE